jgi:hypothetical protein
MKKTSKSSQTSKQGSLFDPPVMVDLAKLLAQAGLSENQQGIVKRRLLESRDSFKKVLQLLLQQAEQLNQTIDLDGSFDQLEKNETREVRSFDSIAKVLAKDFPELLQFILDEYQVDATESRALIGKELIDRG